MIVLFYTLCNILNIMLVYIPLIAQCLLFLDEEKNQSNNLCLSCICPPCRSCIVKEIAA